MLRPIAAAIFILLATPHVARAADADFGARTIVGTFDQYLAETAERSRMPFPALLRRDCKPAGDVYQCNYLASPRTVIWAFGRSERSEVLGLMIFCITSKFDEECTQTLKLTMMTIDPDFPEQRQEGLIADLKKLVETTRGRSLVAGLTATYIISKDEPEAVSERITIYVRPRQ